MHRKPTNNTPLTPPPQVKTNKQTKNGNKQKQLPDRKPLHKPLAVLCVFHILKGKEAFEMYHSLGV